MTPEQKQAEAKKQAVAENKYAQRRKIENKDGRQCLNYSGENDSTVAALTPTLREPDSFEHISTIIGPVNSDGTHKLIMRYRAKNGFGGVSFGITRAVVSNVDCSATIVSNEAS